jgi:hypothetical protein
LAPFLTPDRIANEILLEVLLAQDQVSTALTVMALEVHKRPEMAPRVRLLLGRVMQAIQAEEHEMGMLREL